MSLDIFKPTISVVPKGLEGKIILVYGGNSTGKTSQAVRMSKPYVLAFEKGLNAISGVPYANIKKWADFRKINKQLTGNQVKKAREAYDTIIFDTVEAAALMNEKYIAGKFDAVSISDGNSGYGLWKELEQEFYDQINMLTGAGFTVVFIGHTEENKKTEQIEPKASGDKRSMGIVRNIADIVVYLKSNGVDDDGNAILSTGYTRETPDYFARSRFDLMPNKIDPFTAENLKEAIILGIERKEEAGGVTVDFEEYKELNEEEELDFGELKKELKRLGSTFNDNDMLDEFTQRMQDTFGDGTMLKDLTERQVEAMSVLVDDLQEVLDNMEDEDEEEDEDTEE